MEVPRSSKTGEYDDTVILGLGDSARAWVPGLLEALLQRARRLGKTFLFEGLSLSAYERYFREAASAAGLKQLRMTPHSLRHGGPSTDVLTKSRSLLEAKAFGRWSMDRSVHRYEKHGRLLRQVGKLSLVQKAKANRLRLTLPRNLLKRLASRGAV